MALTGATAAASSTQDLSENSNHVCGYYRPSYTYVEVLSSRPRCQHILYMGTYTFSMNSRANECQAASMCMSSLIRGSLSVLGTASSWDVQRYS